MYYHFFVKDTTIGVNNVNDQLALDVKKAEELTEEEKDEFEERWFMEASYYSNAKNNGVQLQELKYNYFTGYNLTSDQYRSTGMQYMGDFNTYSSEVNSKEEAQNKVLSEFYYYDTTNGITWSGFKGQYGSVSTTLNREQQFIIKIDDRPFSIQLTGKYDVHGKFLFIKYKKGTAYFDYGDVFDCVFTAIKSNDKGYGDYYITLDLSQYFTIKEYDTCTPSYDTEQDKIDTTYWQERMSYNLDENSKLNGKELFAYRYSEVYGGYFLSLTMDAKKLFAEMPRAKVNVMLDLDSEYFSTNGINVVGLDYNAFEGVELDTFTVKGKDKTLYLLEKSMSDTNLQVLKRNFSIKLEIANGALNSVYREVFI